MEGDEREGKWGERKVDEGNQRRALLSHRDDVALCSTPQKMLRAGGREE